MTLIQSLRDLSVSPVSAPRADYQNLLLSLPDVVLLLREGVIDWVSPSLTSLLGWSQEDWQGKPLEQFIHPEGLPTTITMLLGLDKGQRVMLRLRLLELCGSYRWVEIHAGPYLDKRGQLDGVVACFWCIDKDMQVHDELKHRASVDELTNLFNRREGLQRLKQLFISNMYNSQNLALLFCDIDHFKTINDLYGHSCGDLVLKSIAERIAKGLRSQDIAASLGGDELLVVLSGVSKEEDAVRIAEKLRSSVAEPILWNGKGIRATLSIGVALASPHESTDEALARADEALYEAKRNGRDQVACPLA